VAHPGLPLFLFVVLFGLSMDYHVFVLSRVRELVDRGMSTDKAVAEGIRGTTGVITSAAAVMVVTFAAFAIGDSQDKSRSASAWPSSSSSTPRSSARSCCPRR